jgi:hypothetical protein
LNIRALVPCALALAFIGCASPLDDDDDSDEETAQAESEVKKKQAHPGFRPNTAIATQTDPWSCTVHVTTWMLQATGHGVTYDQVLATSFHNGMRPGEPGTIQTMAATLDAHSSKRVIPTAGVSFDRVKAKAGRVAVGIIGANWRHAVGVRGYDAERDALILANSQPGLGGVTRRIGRKDFAKLGSFVMITLE